MQRRIPYFHRRLERQSSKEILQRSRPSRTWVCAHDAAQERNAATSIAIRGVRDFVVVHFAAELNRVFTRCVRDMIHELRDRIGPLKFRPLETAKSRKEITAKADAW